MSKIIAEKDPFLNFSFLTSAFYNFILISNDNFKKIKLPENDVKFDEEFEKLNFENYSNYLEYLSYLNGSGEEIDKIKIKLINSVVKMEFNDKKKEKIVFILSDKMNISIFANKNKLIKLLSIQIINFLFDIYELINLIIKNMDNNEKKIQQITIENLIETSKLKSDKDNLSNKNFILEEKIKSLKKKINSNKEKSEDFLQKKNKDLEKEISKLKETMKIFENKMEKVQNSLLMEKKERDEEIKKANDLLTKQIEDKKKLEEQVEKTNDLLVKHIEDKKKLEEQVEKLKKKVQELDESNDCLFNEMQNIRKKDYTDENYQYMKNLNIKLLEELIVYNDKKLELYKGENDMDNFKNELKKRDLKIDSLQKLKIIYEKDLQVKEKKIDELRLEIERLKNANQ